MNCQECSTLIWGVNVAISMFGASAIHLNGSHGKYSEIKLQTELTFSGWRDMLSMPCHECSEQCEADEIHRYVIERIWAFQIDRGLPVNKATKKMIETHTEAMISLDSVLRHCKANLTDKVCKACPKPCGIVPADVEINKCPFEMERRVMRLNKSQQTPGGPYDPVSNEKH